MQNLTYLAVFEPSTDGSYSSLIYQDVSEVAIIWKKLHTWQQKPQVSMFTVWNVTMRKSSLHPLTSPKKIQREML